MCVEDSRLFVDRKTLEFNDEKEIAIGHIPLPYNENG